MIFVSPKRMRLTLLLLLPSLFGGCAGCLAAQSAAPAAEAPVMTGRYHFLGPQDELAILQEETMLKGYIDVYQGENESDALLSYPLIIGVRKGNHVEFRTRAIHEKYYRFTGTVERGSGKKPGDRDYLQLVGTLETCASNSVTGQKTDVRTSVLFQSMAKGEGEQD